MSGREEINMELGSIGSKSILLLYVIVAFYPYAGTDFPWHILIFLIYICLNTAGYIAVRNKPKQLLAWLSCVLAAGAACVLDPLFVLLLPVNLGELAAFYFKRTRIALVAALLPMLFLSGSLLPLYGCMAALSFIVYAMARRHKLRVKLYEQRLERMSGEVEKLTRSLSDNNEYIRQSEYTFKLEERNRLSQEIHDKIGHAMTGALIQMEASKRLLGSDSAKAAELLQNAISISKEGIESIRQTLKNMKPPTEQLGIGRMRLLIDEFSAKHNVAATLTYGGDTGAIQPIHWKIIQQNTVEAMTNALKYADATAVYIDIRVFNSMIRAVVSDNGKGAGKIVKGLGLLGMEERTAGVNGTVITDGTKGFSVTTLIPLRAME